MSRLETKRIKLRKISVKDAQMLAGWFNDGKNVQFMGTYVRAKKHNKSGERKDIKKHCRFKDEYAFIIILKKAGLPIGAIGINCIDRVDKRGDLWFLIGEKKFQNKGFCKEAAMLALNFGFEKIRLHSITASATPENKPSVEVLKKSGFKLIGRGRDYNRIHGRYYDEFLFNILKDDFIKIRHKIRDNQKF